MGIQALVTSQHLRVCFGNTRVAACGRRRRDSHGREHAPGRGRHCRSCERVGKQFENGPWSAAAVVRAAVRDGVATRARWARSSSVPRRRCTPTTMSTWGSPPTIRFPPRCTSPRCCRSDPAPCRRSVRSAKRSWAKAEQWVDVVKTGRTHLQDATPLTVGLEWSGRHSRRGLDADEFARIVDPNTMVGDPRHDLASAVVS